jgi:hypothetical protein
MKKIKIPLNIYSVAIVIFLFALLRLSHAIMVFTHPKASNNALEKGRGLVTSYPQTVFPSLKK